MKGKSFHTNCTCSPYAAITYSMMPALCQARQEEQPKSPYSVTTTLADAGPIIGSEARRVSSNGWACGRETFQKTAAIRINASAPIPIHCCHVFCARIFSCRRCFWLLRFSFVMIISFGSLAASTQHFESIGGFGSDDCCDLHVWKKTGVGFRHPFALTISATHENTTRRKPKRTNFKTYKRGVSLNSELHNHRF